VSRFASLKVRHNIMIAVAVAGPVAAAVGGIGMYKISQVADSADAMYGRALLPAADAADLREAVWRYRFYGIGANSLPDPAQRAQFNTARDAAAGDIDEPAQRFGGRDLDAAQRDAITAFSTTWADYLSKLKQGTDMIAAGRATEGQVFLVKQAAPVAEQAAPVAEQAAQKLTVLADVSRTTAQARLADANDRPRPGPAHGRRRPRHRADPRDRRGAAGGAGDPAAAAAGPRRAQRRGRGRPDPGAAVRRETTNSGRWRRH
jgi:methyl-accepting chemotaxis protein